MPANLHPYRVETGFTLIELVITVVVLAAGLAGILEIAGVKSFLL